jgi:hypothetical protein
VLLPQHLYVNAVISEEKKTNLNNVEKSLKIYFLILLDLQRSMDMMILDIKVVKRMRKMKRRVRLSQSDIREVFLV